MAVVRVWGLAGQDARSASDRCGGMDAAVDPRAAGEQAASLGQIEHCRASPTWMVGQVPTRLLPGHRRAGARRTDLGPSPVRIRKDADSLGTIDPRMRAHSGVVYWRGNRGRLELPRPKRGPKRGPKRVPKRVRSKARRSRGCSNTQGLRTRWIDLDDPRRPLAAARCPPRGPRSPGATRLPPPLGE